MLTATLDPSPAPLRTPRPRPPRVGGRRLRVMGRWRRQRVPHPEWLSDALCRAVTGEGLVRRPPLQRLRAQRPGVPPRRRAHAVTVETCDARRSRVGPRPEPLSARQTETRGKDERDRDRGRPRRPARPHSRHASRRDCGAVPRAFRESGVIRGKVRESGGSRATPDFEAYCPLRREFRRFRPEPGNNETGVMSSISTSTRRASDRGRPSRVRSAPPPHGGDNKLARMDRQKTAMTARRTG